MALVDILNKDTEEAAASLRDLQAVLTKADNDLETNCNEIDTLQEAWTAISETIENLIDEITDHITEQQEAMEKVGTGLLGSLAGLGGAFTDFENQFQALDTDLGNLEFEAVDSGLEEFKKSAQEIVESCQELGQVLDSDGEELRAKLVEVLDTGSETNMFVSNATDTSTTYQSNLDTEFQEATAAVGQELKEKGLTSLSDFKTHLGGDVKDTLTSGMEDLQTALGDAYSSFKDTVETTAGDLQDKLGELAGDLADDFREEAGEQIEQFLRDAMEDAVEGFAKDAAEDITMMGMGTQFTGALSPILPELKVAEKVLPAFNAALAAMNPFS